MVGDGCKLDRQLRVLLETATEMFVPVQPSTVESRNWQEIDATPGSTGRSTAGEEEL